MATLAPANLINRRRRGCHTAGNDAVSRGEMTQVDRKPERRRRSLLGAGRKAECGGMSV